MVGPAAVPPVAGRVSALYVLTQTQADTRRDAATAAANGMTACNSGYDAVSCRLVPVLAARMLSQSSVSACRAVSQGYAAEVASKPALAREGCPVVASASCTT